MLLLDQPTSALSPRLAAQGFDIIQQLPNMNVAALVIEQRARQSLQISHRGTVLDAGRVVLNGAADDLPSDPRMADLTLGRHAPPVKENSA